MGFKSKKGQDNKGASGTKKKQETRRPLDRDDNRVHLIACVELAGSPAEVGGCGRVARLSFPSFPFRSAGRPLDSGWPSLPTPSAGQTPTPIQQSPMW